MAFVPKMNAAAIAIGTLLLLGQCCCVVTSTPDTSRRLYLCNTETYKDSDPYRRSVDYVLNELLDVTANTPGYNLYEKSPYADSPPAFGHGTCGGTLLATDCATCILAAYNEIRSLCNGHIGAQVHLNDCTIRYENYEFTEPEL